MYLRNTLSEMRTRAFAVYIHQVLLPVRTQRGLFPGSAFLTGGAQAGVCGKTNPAFRKTTLCGLTEIETHLWDKGSFAIAFYFCVLVSTGIINTQYLFGKKQTNNSS